MGFAPVADIRGSDQYRVMSTRCLPVRAFLAGLIFALAGCDPGVHVAWQRDFKGNIDFDCIEDALRMVASDVKRGSYLSDGNGPRRFKRGVTVTQFSYSDPAFIGGYTLDVAVQPDGTTHYWHEWGKIGTSIPPDEQRRVVPLLNRANRSVARRCGLSFDGSAPTVGDG